MIEVLDIGKLKERIAQVAKERDWDQFHSPKNLAMALSVEASELTEIFQWLTPEQSWKISSDTETFTAVKEELADIVVYIVRLCGILDIDLPLAIDDKMTKNIKKYPVEKARGNAKKYNKL